MYVSSYVYNSHWEIFQVLSLIWFNNEKRKRRKQQKKNKHERKFGWVSVNFKYTRHAAHLCAVMFVFSNFPPDLRSRWNVANQPTSTTATQTENTRYEYSTKKRKPLWISNYRPATSYKVKNEKKLHLHSTPEICFGFKIRRKWHEASHTKLSLHSFTYFFVLKWISYGI